MELGNPHPARLPPSRPPLRGEGHSVYVGEPTSTVHDAMLTVPPLTSACEGQVVTYSSFDVVLSSSAT